MMDSYDGLKYWLLRQRWDYWVIWTPVGPMRHIARRLFERQCPKDGRVKRTFWSISAARRSQKAQAKRFGHSASSPPSYKRLDLQRRLFDRNTGRKKAMYRYPISWRSGFDRW